MLIWACDAPERFHWNVPATGGGAVGFSFQGDDLIAAVGLAFTNEHRGLIVAHPNAVECLLDVVKSQQSPAGEWFAHHLTMKLFLQEPAIESEAGLSVAWSHFRRTCRIHPTLHFGFPIACQSLQRFVGRPRSPRSLHLFHHLLFVSRLVLARRIRSIIGLGLSLRFFINISSHNLVISFVIYLAGRTESRQ